MDSLSPKLRIWHISETYPPEYGGGAAIGIQETCRRLVAQGHELRVLCTENANREPYTISVDYDGPIRVERVNLPYFKTHDPDGWKLGMLRWRKHERRISKLIEERLTQWRPDIAHYHTSRPFGEECLITIGRHKVPLVAMLHEAWLICARLMLLQSPTSKPCPGPTPLRCVECIYSHYDGTHQRALLKLLWRLPKLGIYPAYRLWRRSVARKQVRAVNGISKFMVQTHQPHINGLAQYTPYSFDLTGLPAKNTSRPMNPLRFGFMAGFQSHKGIGDVLDAAVSLKQQGYLFKLHVWGPGQEIGKSEIKTRGLEDFVLLRGMYAHAQRWQAYNEVDVAIMATTVCEPLGRIPIEAAAVGAPTIAPAVGGIVETIRDGVDGLLYRFQDKQDLEKQMKRLLQEPGLFHQLASNLQPSPNVRDNTSTIEDFYLKVLGLADSQGSGLAIQTLSPLTDHS